LGAPRDVEPVARLNDEAEGFFLPIVSMMGDILPEAHAP
jgi:hypothetical protein